MITNNNLIPTANAKSRLPLNCALCKHHHLSFNCPLPLMTENTTFEGDSEVPPSKTTNSCQNNAQMSLAATRTTPRKNTFLHEPDRNNNNIIRERNVITLRVRGFESDHNRFNRKVPTSQTSRPPGTAPRPTILRQQPPRKVPQPPVQIRPPMPSFPPRSARRPLQSNPGAYCGSRGFGQQMRNACVPDKGKMDKITKLLRPFAYGDEDDYEEVELPLPPPPALKEKKQLIEPVSTMTPLPPPLMPADKMFMFQTVEEYDEHNVLLATSKKSFEFTLGGPRDAIVFFDCDF